MTSRWFLPDRLGGWRCHQLTFGADEQVWGEEGTQASVERGVFRGVWEKRVEGTGHAGLGIPPLRVGREEGAVGAVGWSERAQERQRDAQRTAGSTAEPCCSGKGCGGREGGQISGQDQAGLGSRRPPPEHRDSLEL